MIKVIGSSKEDVTYTVIYNQSSKVLEIESSSMCDDCIPYEVSEGCMIWVDKDKMLCEMECLFSVMTENLGNLLSNDTEVFDSTPKLKVSFEEKPVEIAFNHSQLTLIFNKNRKPDKKYISSNINFFVSEDEVIAMVCAGFELI